MAEDILVCPPIRQSVEDLASAQANDSDPPKTEKSWYLYWQKTGERVNLNSKKLAGLVTYGPHADRPPADSMPDGAIYVESDRTVIYQNINGAWHYLAGTMWGTITPDLRPTDLGVNDGGFDYRGTDDNREFIWSQTQWIEVSAVRYGIHSARPAPVDVADGSMYVESDRGGVIYQEQAGVWKYLAGTMYGTLSPDQRPTDLGVNDGGFEFRGTDQQRQFIWSQTAWVEVTEFWTAVTGGIAYTAGRVGIGTTNVAAPLHVHEGTDQNVAFGPVGGYNALQSLNDAVSTYVPMLYQASTHSFQGGNVGIGAFSSYQLGLTSDSAAKPSTNTWTVVSDIRVKRNVSRFEGDMEVIRRLDPIVAEYTGQGGTPEGMRVVSLDAAALREIVPQAVSSVRGRLNPDDAEETEILGVNTHEIFYHMLRAIQQMDRELETLRQRIGA